MIFGQAIVSLDTMSKIQPVKPNAVSLNPNGLEWRLDRRFLPPYVTKVDSGLVEAGSKESFYSTHALRKAMRRVFMSELGNL